MHKKTSFYSFAVASAVCFMIVGAVPNSVLAASFQGLGDLPGGGFSSSARAVSADGSVVVGYSSSASGVEAFRWTSGSGMVGLGDLPGGSFWSEAYGVSADGSVVVGFSDSASGVEAFRWTSGGGMVGLGDLPGPLFRSGAYGVSADGSVIVGESFSASGIEAFRWTSGGGMVGLGDLPGGIFDSVAYAVSGDGSVVVGQGVSASGDEAFRWKSTGGMVGLGDFPGGTFRSRAYGVSADGSVVVGYGEIDFGTSLRAFIWDALDGMRNLQDVLVNDYGLDLTGWTLRRAAGVSPDGLTIVGYGVNPSSDTEAWIATLEPALVPATSLWGLMIVAVGIIVGAAIAMSSRSDRVLGNTTC